MLLKDFKKTTVISKLKIENSKVIHIYPDFSLDIISFMNNNTINKANLLGVVIQSDKFKNKQLNKAEYIKDLKNSEEKLKIKSFVTNVKLKKNQWIIIDHTLGLKRLEELSTKLSLVQMVDLFFDYMRNQYNSSIKFYGDLPQYNIISFKDTNGLYKIIHKSLTLKLDKYKSYTKFTLGNVYPSGEFLTIGGLDRNNEVDMFNSNVFKIEKILNNNIKNDIKPKILEINIDDISGFKKDASKDETKLSVAEYDNIKLSKIIRKYNVRDPDINKIINKNIDDYLEKFKNVKRDDLEQLILKSINYYLFGNDKVDQKYLDNPELLFIKLEKDVDFSEKLIFPKLKNKTLIQPRDIIKLDRISGPKRLEFEYSENIHEVVNILFKTLENRENPIKIKSIKHEIKDNNVDRFTEYSITLQNQVGGNTTPYVVKLRLPSLLNGRYFKFNGKEYIQSTQHYLMPITKNRETECRFLSHYGMATVSIENVKFSTSDIHSVLKYINNKYPSIVEKSSNTNGIFDYIEFKNGVIIEPLKLDFFRHGDKVVNKKQTPNKNEFIYEELLKQVQQINSNENFNLEKKVEPYLLMHLVGIKIPYILYFWQQEGLLNALIRHEIKFNIEDNPNPEYKLQIELGDNKYLNIDPKNKRQDLIVNGLLLRIVKKHFQKITSKELNDKTSIFDYISTKYNSRKNDDLNRVAEKSVDPTTAKIMEFYDMPTNLNDILSGPLLDKLLNEELKHLNDMGERRARLAEYMSHLLYNEVNMAHNRYSNQLEIGQSDAKMFLDENYIIKNLLGKHKHESASGGGIIEWVNAFSPVDEIMKASKTTVSGRGGVPNKRAIRKSQRSVHESAIGNMAAHSTTESSDVGIINYHTLNPSISNTYGSYGNKKTMIDVDDNWSNIGLDEALIPFVNQMDSTRLILARTHRGQVIPVTNAEPPIVSTGAEYIAPQLASSKFVITSPKNGVIDKIIPDNYITVKYDDGGSEAFDISPRLN